jgi:hypothetical protein
MEYWSMDHNRQWLPHFSELVDRLSIHQLKEVFIPEHKEKYAKEMTQIMNDLDLLIEERHVHASSELIRCCIILGQINTHIWYNESEARKGEQQDLKRLQLTHGLNGIRNNVQNYLLELIGQLERKDYKTDCLAAEFKDWEISLGLYRDNKAQEVKP